MKMYSLIYKMIEKADVHELKRLDFDLNENVLRGVSAHFHHSETYRNRTQEAILYLVNKSQELPRGIYSLNEGSLDNAIRYKDRILAGQEATKNAEIYIWSLDGFVTEAGYDYEVLDELLNQEEEASSN